MAINILWSSTNGGATIGSPVSHGTTLRQNSHSSPQTLYIRHDGINPITSCGIYSRAYSATYTGDSSADADMAELLEWGDGGSATIFGGIQFNQNATGSFPDVSWSTLANKTTIDTYGDTVRTGIGDSSSNLITIKSVSGATSDGTIQAGSSPNVRFQMRISIPTDEITSGIRLFETLLSYSYTS